MTEKLPRRRLHVPESRYGALALGPLNLQREEAHYIRSVLRLSVGDAVQLFDGCGRLATSVVAPAAPPECLLNVVSVGEAVAPWRSVCVAVAAPKGERTGWMVEKLTELGVTSIVFLQTRFSQPQGPRLDRLHRLVAAAARQAGVDTLPTLTEPMALDEFAAQSFLGSCYVAEPTAPSIQAVLRHAYAQYPATVVIGPEGGLAPDETSALSKAGFTPIGLGRNILRVETAALVAAAALIV